MRKIKPTPFPTNPELIDSIQFGHAVRSARTTSGMTLENAALFLGMAKQTLSDIELGKSTVSLGNALKAAKWLGVSIFVVPATEREKTKFKLKNNY